MAHITYTTSSRITLTIPLLTSREPPRGATWPAGPTSCSRNGGVSPDTSSTIGYAPNTN